MKRLYKYAPMLVPVATLFVLDFNFMHLGGWQYASLVALLVFTAAWNSALGWCSGFEAMFDIHRRAMQSVDAAVAAHLKELRETLK